MANKSNEPISEGSFFLSWIGIIKVLFIIFLINLTISLFIFTSITIFVYRIDYALFFGIASFLFLSLIIILIYQAIRNRFVFIKEREFINELLAQLNTKIQNTYKNPMNYYLFTDQHLPFGFVYKFKWKKKMYYASTITVISSFFIDRNNFDKSIKNRFILISNKRKAVNRMTFGLRTYFNYTGAHKSYYVKDYSFNRIVCKKDEVIIQEKLNLPNSANDPIESNYVSIRNDRDQVLFIISNKICDKQKSINQIGNELKAILKKMNSHKKKKFYLEEITRNRFKGWP